MKRIKVLKAYFITWLFIFYVVYANLELLSTFFMATVVFSSAILGLLAVGTLYQIISGYDIMMLGGTFGALAYKKTGYEFYLRRIDAILPANIAYMLQSRKTQQKMLFTQEESRSIIDWLEGKFQKQKVYINFFINTSMMIGLLGTFVGLVEAIDHMGQIIIGLNDDVDIKQIMRDFSGPISGMAIGFGASLFGVVGAVILGINGYILFKYQDALISGIEDWLKDRIIETASNTPSEAINGAPSDLPGQRKSFMDLFIEQMGFLSTEISKLSQTSSNTQMMTDSLVAIKSLFESNQQSVQQLIRTNEQTNSKLSEILDGMLENQKNIIDISMQEKTVLQGIFEKHGNLLTSGTAELERLNSNSDKIQLKLNDTVSALTAIKEIQTDGFSQMQSSGNSINSTIGKLQERLAKDGNELREISSTQKNGINEIVSLRDDLLGVLTQIDGGITGQTAAIKNLSKHEDRDMGAIQKEQDAIIKELSKLNNAATTFVSTSKNLEERVSKTEDGMNQIADTLKNIEKAITKMATHSPNQKQTKQKNHKEKSFFSSLFSKE